MPTASLLGASKSQSNGNSPRTPTATGKERQAGAQGSKDKGECNKPSMKAISRSSRMFIGFLAECAGIGLHDTGEDIREKFASMKDQGLRDGKFEGLSLSHIAVIDEIDVTIHVQRDGRDERGTFSAFGLMKATLDYHATQS